MGEKSRSKQFIPNVIRVVQSKTYREQPLLDKDSLDQFVFDEEDERRISFYLGNIDKNPVSLRESALPIHAINLPETLQLMDYQSLVDVTLSDEIPRTYAVPILVAFDLLPEHYRKRRFLYIWGDHRVKSTWPGVAAIARKCNDPNVTLLKINPVRLWGGIQDVKDLDIAYHHKKDAMIWRGATTGNTQVTGRRDVLVQQHFDANSYIDVGFSEVVEGQEQYSHLVKGLMSRKEQLRYKFLICLQGNNISSAIHWMLYSNSVVFMPTFSFSSWLMEETLEPFVHYIPLADDFADLAEKYHWAMSHESECLEIAENATRYMEQFFDPRKEILMEAEVLRRYLDNLEILAD